MTGGPYEHTPGAPEPEQQLKSTPLSYRFGGMPCWQTPCKNVFTVGLPPQTKFPAYWEKTNLPSAVQLIAEHELSCSAPPESIALQPWQPAMSG